MAAEEVLDYWNGQGEWLGTSARQDVHAKGLWHRTLHLWLVTPDEGGSIVYQLRSAIAASWPGMLDASVAGHLLAGESYSDALRESREEIGVDVPEASAIALGERREEGQDSSGGWNHEFQGIYVARIDDLWERFEPVDGEAAGLVRIGHEAANRLIRRDAAHIACDALTASGGAVSATVREVTLDSFVPRPSGYYLAMHDIARRLVRGEPAEALAEVFRQSL
jgi:isopentenyldiphosphate isomerase